MTSFVPSTTSGGSLTTFDVSASSATTLQTGVLYYAPNSTGQTEHSAVVRGQKAGIAVGTIGVFKSPFDRDRQISKANNQPAVFALILTLIFLLFKRHRGELPKALPCLARRVLGRWLAHDQTPDTMSDSLLTPEVGARGSLTWDYRETFAQPTVMVKTRRSQPKSLTGLVRFNPLGLNPVSLQTTGTGTPSRNSFVSFFHRHSTTSTYHSDSCPSNLQGQSGIVSDPQAPPPFPPPSYRSPPPSYRSPPPRPPTISSLRKEFGQSDSHGRCHPKSRLRPSSVHGNRATATWP